MGKAPSGTPFLINVLLPLASSNKLDAHLQCPRAFGIISLFLVDGAHPASRMGAYIACGHAPVGGTLLSIELWISMRRKSSRLNYSAAWAFAAGAYSLAGAKLSARAIAQA
jgi:hypothetical protein